VPSRLRSRLEVLAAAVLFSTGGAVIKACAFTSWQVAGFRSAVATIVVLLIMPEGRRHWSRRSVAVGATYAATMVLFVTANKLTTAANTIFLQYTSPLYILLLEPWLLDEPVRRRDLAFLGVLGVGLVLFFFDSGRGTATAPHPTLGNWLALCSGVCWALTAIGLRSMTRGTGSDRAAAASAVVCGNVLAALACAPFALPVAHARAADWLLVAYLGVAQISVAYFFLTRGLRAVSALEATLLLLVEPVLNPVWAWIFHGERPGPWSLAGGSVILVATVVKTWDESRRSGGEP
jgi:drug/metabolite transporter (DMT)-like permease